MSLRLRRARPLLGTLVEISVCSAKDHAARAVDAAFAAVAEVHGLMSAQEETSDISRLNRLAHERRVVVHERTWEVLRTAQRVSEASSGAFDVTAPREGWKAIELLDGCLVHFQASLRVDVSGIAKGYAVDRASAILREHGIEDFVVNAGGDLRVGNVPQTIYVRRPDAPWMLDPLAQLSSAAVATSGPRSAGDAGGPVIVPATGEPLALDRNITVLAKDCMMADALTKVVALLGKASEPVLAAFGAEACITYAGGLRHCLGARPA